MLRALCVLLIVCVPCAASWHHVTVSSSPLQAGVKATGAPAPKGGGKAGGAKGTGAKKGGAKKGE